MFPRVALAMIVVLCVSGCGKKKKKKKRSHGYDESTEVRKSAVGESCSKTADCEGESRCIQNICQAAAPSAEEPEPDRSTAGSDESTGNEPKAAAASTEKPASAKPDSSVQPSPMAPNKDMAVHPAKRPEPAAPSTPPAAEASPPAVEKPTNAKAVLENAPRIPPLEPTLATEDIGFKDRRKGWN